MKPSPQLVPARPRSFPRAADAAADPSHTLQFYEDEGFLAATVGDFLGRALSEGVPAIVIATRPHRDAFLDRLSAKGYEVDAARQDGRLVCLDARDMLAKIMAGGMPDPQRFSATLGGVIETALAGRHSRLYAYGEMVDLLWKDGNHAAALRLEELWNDLLTKYTFSLLCAYSMANFDQHAHSQAFQGVCGRHDRVMPTEQYLESDDRQLVVARLQQQAQTLETEIKRRQDVEAALLQALAARQRAERDHDRLAAIVQSSDDAIVSKDLDGVIKSWNPAAERIFGYPAHEAVGKSIRLIIPANRQGEEDRVLERIRRGEVVDHFETIRIRRDGTEVAVSVTVSPVKDGSGQIVGASKIARDITERHRLEVERQRVFEYERAARVEAEKANRSKDEFLTMLSHELRTPLNAILGWSRIATSQETPHRGNATMHRAFEVIERNATLQLRLVDDLLDVSRIIAGKLHLTLEPVDLVSVLGTVINSLRPAADAKGLDLRVRIDGLSQPVIGDQTRLQQVAWNLVSNAIKFTPAGGRITLRLETIPGAVRIVVEDTGEGIPPEFVPHVFERFRQADSTTTRKHGGLGLGLTVTRYLVEAHGGTISAQSAGKGLGAMFTVTLPDTAQDGQASEQKQSVDAPVRLDGVRLLVLDDDEDARYLLRCMLEHRGAEVTSVKSGDEALSALASRPFDVLLADLGMPDKDGYSLMEAIRDHPAAHVRRIGAVAVTAYSGDAHRSKATASGFDDYLVKPVPINRLARAIMGLLPRE